MDIQSVQTLPQLGKELMFDCTTNCKEGRGGGFSSMDHGSEQGKSHYGKWPYWEFIFSSICHFTETKEIGDWGNEVEYHPFFKLSK